MHTSKLSLSKTSRGRIRSRFSPTKATKWIEQLVRSHLGEEILATNHSGEPHSGTLTRSKVTNRKVTHAITGVKLCKWPVSAMQCYSKRHEPPPPKCTARIRVGES